VTVAVVVVATLGAVYSPVVEIVPDVAFHVTAVLIVPETVSLNCCVPAEATVADVGETEIDTVPLPVLANPVIALKSAALIS